MWCHGRRRGSPWPWGGGGGVRGGGLEGRRDQPTAQAGLWHREWPQPPQLATVGRHAAPPSTAGTTAASGAHRRAAQTRSLASGMPSGSGGIAKPLEVLEQLNLPAVHSAA